MSESDTHDVKMEYKEEEESQENVGATKVEKRSMETQTEETFLKKEEQDVEEEEVAGPDNSINKVRLHFLTC